MFENFPYTNFHDLNLDWIIQKVKEAYSPDNPPEYVVLSVNGETGDVILYRDAVVTLPDVQESQWNIHRLANGQSSGIQFIQGDKAQRIDGTHRYDMYDAGNPPPYPVRSVNGLTGAVTVVKTVNGDNGDVTLYPTAIVEFPDVSEDYFQVKRTAAGTDIGIEFDKNGPAKRLNDTDEYPIYDEGNPPPYPVTSVGTLTGSVAILDTSVVTDQGTQKLKIVFPVTSVDGQTGTVETWGYSDDENIKLPLEAEADIWSISREVPSGELGVRLTVNGLTDNPEGYLVLNDGTNTTTLKILTPADIPSSSGVVSVNGANGVVVLYATDIAMSSTDSATSINAAIAAVNAKTGADIPVSGGDSTKIDAALSSLTTAVNSNATSINGIEDAIAIVANNNTHGAISSGQFVYVKNHGTLAEGLYKASTNIAANAALSSSNLVADSAGGLNALKSDIATLNSNAYQLRGGTSLTSGANLNSFISPGNYYSSSNAITGSLVNCPVSTGAISLKVQHYGNTPDNVWAYGRQVIYVGSTDMTYVRNFETNGSRVATFGSWDSLALNSNSTKVYTGFGQYDCSIYRLGRLRILYVFNGSNLDDGTSTLQLDAIDIPANYMSIGTFTQINSNGDFGSRFLILNTSGVLSVSGTVYRGGWTMIYIAAT